MFLRFLLFANIRPKRKQLLSRMCCNGAGKGYVLNGRYLAISLLSYSLILINFIGFIMFEFYIEPLVYDIVCAIVLTLQILILSTRLLSNGIYRNAIPQLLVRIVNFDCSQSRV